MSELDERLRNLISNLHFHETVCSDPYCCCVPWDCSEIIRDIETKIITSGFDREEISDLREREEDLRQKIDLLRGWLSEIAHGDYSPAERQVMALHALEYRRKETHLYRRPG